MKVVIWGAGNVGKNIAFSLRKDCELVAFIDKDTKKAGKELLGVKIRTVETLKTLTFDAIIIANTYGKEIKKYVCDFFPDKIIIDPLAEGILDARITTLNSLAEEIAKNDIQGSVAEAGVYKGDFTAYLDRAFENRKIYLFDTFKGFMSEDIVHDGEMNFSETDPSMFSDATIALVKEKIVHNKNIFFKQGNFPDTTVGLENEQFCFASIDFDLYRPTADAIEFFYTRLASGGYIMIHDYYNDDFRGVQKAVDMLKKTFNYAYLPLPDGGGSVVLCKP